MFSEMRVLKRNINRNQLTDQFVLNESRMGPFSHFLSLSKWKIILAFCLMTGIYIFAELPDYKRLL